MLFEQAGLPDGIWMYEDLGYKDRLFCSPRIFREIIFPYFKEMVDFFHSYDLPVVLHSCGCVTEALPLIVEVGFDGLNPMEVNAGCDVVKYAEKYGDKLAFVGGFDARIFETNDKDLIRREVISLMRKMKSVGARWVFASDHSISYNTRYESYKHAVEVYREHRMY
jgi:uroporphyrinogen decarboxylase